MCGIFCVCFFSIQDLFNGRKLNVSVVSFLLASFTGPRTITTAKNPNHYDIKKRRANPPPVPFLVFIQYKRWNRSVFSLKITRKYTFFLSDHCPWTSIESLFLGNIIKLNQKNITENFNMKWKTFFSQKKINEHDWIGLFMR